MAKKHIRLLLLTVVMTLLFGMSVWAKDYTKKGTYRWVFQDGLYYAYDAETGELLRNCKVGKCYVNEEGTRILNQFVKGVYYNTKGVARKNFTGGWIKSEGKVYYFYKKRLQKGYKKISGYYYYFNQETGERMSGVYLANGKYRFFKKNGVQVTKKGWKTIDGKRYYLAKGGIIYEGFITVKKKKYYQTADKGILTGEQVIDGAKYYFYPNGVYNEEMTQRLRESNNLGAESDILFFTKFESGSVGYAQTGGDGGKACGKYQFDYRYALIPFIKYCYNANATFFEDFRPFLNISPGDSSLINNSKLYAAWTKCYNADPTYFSNMQDQYAIESYYQVAEKYLAERGITLTLRPYVVRGAVFSYAIQHGTITAAQGVIAAGCNDTMTNKEFLEKLYDYRWSSPSGWNKNSAYSYRYTQEKALALSILSSLG